MRHDMGAAREGASRRDLLNPGRGTLSPMDTMLLGQPPLAPSAVPTVAGEWPKMGRVALYAIAFDLHQDSLKTAYPNDSYQNAYQQIGSFLAKRGFTRQQGSVYFGDETVTAVTAILAVQELAKAYTWSTPRSPTSACCGLTSSTI